MLKENSRTLLVVFFLGWSLFSFQSFGHHGHEMHSLEQSLLEFQSRFEQEWDRSPTLEELEVVLALREAAENKAQGGGFIKTNFGGPALDNLGRQASQLMCGRFDLGLLVSGHLMVCYRSGGGWYFVSGVGVGADASLMLTGASFTVLHRPETPIEGHYRGSLKAVGYKGAGGFVEMFKEKAPGPKDRATYRPRGPIPQDPSGPVEIYGPIFGAGIGVAHKVSSIRIF